MLDHVSRRKAQPQGPDRDWIRPRDLDPDPRPGEHDDRKEGNKGDEAKKGDDPKKGDEGKDEKKSKPLPRWPFIVAAVLLAAFAAVVLWIIFRPRPDVWTDDAYVRVHYATVAPRISGQIATIPVNNNDSVKVGQVLATLDPRDNETAVQSAQAQLDRDIAQVGYADANIQRQPFLIDQQQGAVDSAKSKLAFSGVEAGRYTYLAVKGAGTIQQHQQADATMQENKASLQSAEAELEATKKQLDVLKQQKSSAEATVMADRAELEKAKLNLSYTQILSPVDGMVGERSIQVGDIVSPGTTLMTVVPLDRVYIEANYREVDLAHMRSGQHVTVHVDAYNIDLDGTVDGIPPASGATYAPIAPTNATGNFTKIVQRLPVKIDVNPNQPLAKLLRVGFSVETTIHTGSADVVAEQRNSAARVTGR